VVHSSSRFETGLEFLFDVLCLSRTFTECMHIIYELLLSLLLSFKLFTVWFKTCHVNISHFTRQYSYSNNRLTEIVDNLGKDYFVWQDVFDYGVIVSVLL